MLKGLTIKKVAQGLRSGDFSAEELTKAHLAAIGENDGDLNSYIYVDEENALNQARKVDAKLKAGEDLPLLSGVPMALKDILKL